MFWGNHYKGAFNINISLLWNFLSEWVSLWWKFSQYKMRELASGGHVYVHAAYFSKAYGIVMTGSKKHNQCAYGDNTPGSIQ